MSPASGNSCPAPDFSRRLARHPGPDDRPWWRLWMSGYAVPAVYTARRAGLLDACAGRHRSIEEVAGECAISLRAARVLLNLLASLDLLEVRDGAYRAAAETLERFGKNAGGGWADWLAGHYETPVTPERLHRYLTRADEVAFPEAPAGAGDERLINLPWGFPATVAADRLGVPAVLAASAGGFLDVDALVARLPGTGRDAADVDPDRLERLLARLGTAGVVVGDAKRGFALSPDFGDFLDPDGCYYKGGTLRLMEMAPPSAPQAWEALAGEQAPAESRMDETIKSPDLNETYAFALHMDAQGAGADAALARSGLIRPSDRVLDLAGGAGSYSICSALQSPATRFFLLEQHPMTEVARLWTQQHGVASNVEVLEGDMFKLGSLEPVLADVRPNTVFASNIFHDWTPDKNLALAREVYAVLPAGGRFILHEMPLAEDGYSNDIAAGFSETLRIWTEGMQYKLSELEEILRAAGFTSIETADSLGPFKFIIGTRR